MPLSLTTVTWLRWKLLGFEDRSFCFPRLEFSIILRSLKDTAFILFLAAHAMPAGGCRGQLGLLLPLLPRTLPTPPQSKQKNREAPGWLTFRHLHSAGRGGRRGHGDLFGRVRRERERRQDITFELGKAIGPAWALSNLPGPRSPWSSPVAQGSEKSLGQVLGV